MKPKNYRPVEPVNKKMFLQLGLSIDPKSIPPDPLEKSIIQLKREEIANLKAEAIKDVELKFPDAIAVEELPK